MTTIERILELEKDYFDHLICNTESPIPPPSAARAFAVNAHKGLTYGGDKPYVFHLDIVVGVLLDFGIRDFVILDAAYLHDTVEDTEVTIEEIEYTFGLQVAQLVRAVTDPPGLSRKERHKISYPVIKATPRADVLKLADRIGNIKHSIESGDKGFVQMYAREHNKFKDFIYKPENEEAAPLWSYLENLMGGPDGRIQ